MGRNAQRRRRWRKERDEPTPVSAAEVEAALVAIMQEAEIDPALIYAVQQTGRLVTESNMHLLTEEELDEWQDAVDRYETLTS